MRVVCLGYDRRVILFSILDNVNAIMSLVSIKDEQALLAIRSIPCPSIEVALQPVCCKLIGGEVLVATMRNCCSLVCIIIICIEPATVLAIAVVNDDRWKNSSQALQLASAPGPAWGQTAW